MDPGSKTPKPSIGKSRLISLEEDLSVNLGEVMGNM
jgi:hypothetical protein